MERLRLNGTVGWRTRVAEANGRCREFLSKNARQILLAEEALRGLALLAPGGDSEYRAEVANTILGLLAVYRDSATDEDSPQRKAPAVLLSVLRASQVLCEFSAERRVGRRKKYLVLLLIEIGKAVLRLILLSGKRAGEPLLIENEKLRMAVPEHTCKNQQELVSQRGIRSGRKIVTLAAVQEHENFDELFEKVYDIQSHKGMGGLLTERCEACVLNAQLEEEGNGVDGPIGRARRGKYETTWCTIAEMLHILRPVIYLSLVRVFGWKSWKPWCASLAVDMAALGLMSPGAPKERNRRALNIIFYFVRSPFFDVVTKKIVFRLARILGRLPLVGSSVQSGTEVASKLQTYYFYTSAS